MIKIICLQTICFILLLFVSCRSDDEKKQKNEIFFYSVTRSKNHPPIYGDSVVYEKVKHVSDNDLFLAQEAFELDGETHWINLFTNEPFAVMDGGYVAYELDTLGIIYTKSLTWNSYGRLRSTNDSVNEIINVAIEQILLKESLHNIDFDHLNPIKRN